MSNDSKKTSNAFAVIEGFQRYAADGRLNDAGKAKLAEAEECLASMSGRGVLSAYRVWRDSGRFTIGPLDEMVVSSGGGLSRDVSKRLGRRPQ